MASISALQDHELQGEAISLLAQTQKKLGRVPNMYRVMAHSPAGLSANDLQLLREKAFTDGEVLEIIANVVRNIFTNYLNVIAGTAVDWQ